MKKIATILLACLPLLVYGQTYDTISGPDGRYYKYHYTSWFDSCYSYTDTIYKRYGYPDVPGRLKLVKFNYYDFATYPGSPVVIPPVPAKTEYVSRPTAVKGVAVVTSEAVGDPWMGWVMPCNVTDSTADTLVPDTCMIFTVNNYEANVQGLSRWDTATPKIYKVPWNIDSARGGFAYLKVYEANFKTPIEVNDTFYITGTPYNTQYDGLDGHCMRIIRYYITFNSNIPTVPGDPCWMTDEERQERRNNPTGYEVSWNSVKPVIRRSATGGTAWGAFFPILSDDSVSLGVSTGDSTMGTVSPTGTQLVLQWVTHTITAIPKTGYKFTHWNDGNTDNPRRVRVIQDTAFTAYFAPKEQYQLTLSSANPDAGSVVGGGTYYELDTVRMEAIPSSDRYAFDFWDDGNVSNPRYHVMRSDTSFIAFFKDFTAIDEADASSAFFTLTPNPTDGKVVVEVKSGKSGVATITLCDATGREVLKQKASTLNSQLSTLNLEALPAGTYFVTVTIGGQSGTRKLVVK